MSTSSSQKASDASASAPGSGDITSTSGSKVSSGMSAETAATSVSGSKSGEPGVKPWRDQSFTPPEGRVGNLTAEHQQVLDQYREELRKEGLLVEPRMDDVYLLRFLRARKWSIPDAVLMMRNAEKWREEMKVDEIYASFQFTEKEQVFSYYPQFYHKTDKDGRPLYIEKLGKVKAKDLRKVTTKERQLQNLILEYERLLRERLPACSEAVGHPVETSCTILDLKDASILEFYNVSDYVQEASKIGQDYYPETMGKFYLVNTPWLLSKIWGIVEGWLDPITREKIKSLGSKETKAGLLAQVPAENLPVDLGGLCACAPNCQMADEGPWKKVGGAPV